jgi:hypothetical protein
MIGKAWAVESVWGALHVSDIQPTVRLRGLFSFAQGTPHLVWQLPCRNSNDYVRMFRRIQVGLVGVRRGGLDWARGMDHWRGAVIYSGGPFETNVCFVFYSDV